MNLATHWLARDTYRLLNKNLNFIPTPNGYSKQKRDTELQNFYRLVKLKRYFQNKQNQLPIDEDQSGLNKRRAQNSTKGELEALK